MIFRKKEQPLEVIIGPESGIRGDLTTKGVVKLDGTIDGCINADWLIVGETGAVKGDVASRGAVIYGKVEGNINSGETIEIRSQAVVEGDIYTARLVISEGALFDGRSYMQKTPDVDNDGILPLEKKSKTNVSE